MASSSSQGRASSSRRICKYDVFLSFRGTDTRNNFTDHLYNHLLRKGVFTFKDDKRLEKGQPISSQLLQAVRDSRVSIVVFSRDYAGSTWCLEEMAAIVDCQKELEQFVYPVFVGVDPSHVRNQNGAYGDAFFALHAERFREDPDKVDRWKTAMTCLASSVGWDVRDRSEAKEIEKIVLKVTKKLDHKFSGFADDLVGIQPRVERLEKLLKLSSKDDDFRVLGIWGMGGIGKTTHATVLYDRISYQFDACCFIENVSKIYKDGGATAVQKQILRQALGGKNLDTYSPSEISGIITNRLYNLKVLIVLDNVDQFEQLQELAINSTLLTAESRIIITTRDEHILKVYEADEVHEVPLLDNGDAHDLLCRKAFKSGDSSSNVVELIPAILNYVQSLPLAIKVLGSFLCMRDVIQWKDALNRLGENPDNKIMDVLQISFEGLQPDEKEIFLHIACFFKGDRLDYVKRILNCCGLHPHIGIPVITEKSLITIRNQEIHMHEMLQELGKKIVRQKFPGEPRSWSRLWLYRDFCDILETDAETNNVNAIVLDQKEDVSKFSQLRAGGLSKMRGLRLLILYQKNFIGKLNFLPNSLQYLLWHGYPFASLPLNYEPYNSLMELNMPDSSIQRLWVGRKHLPHVKRMDVSNARYLTVTPNFEWSPRLERLDFTGCTNIQHVHPSIGLLKQLTFLSFRNCSNLANLDLGTECRLFSLRVLHLSGCTNLENTPDFSGLLNLEYLDLEHCSSLSTVHESIGALALLKFLSLRCCTNLVDIPYSVSTMRSLITFDLWGCLKLRNLLRASAVIITFNMKYLIFLDVGFCSLSELPPAICRLKCLERLNLEGNNFVRPPATAGLSSLAYLNLSHCKELRFYPALPSTGASSVGRYFKTVSGSRDHRSGFYAFDCPMLGDDSRSIYRRSKTCGWLARLSQDPRHFRCGFDIVVPGTEFPLLFSQEFDPGSVIRIVHSDVNDNWIGYAFCVAFHPGFFGSSRNSSSSQLLYPFYLSFENQHTEECFHMLHLKPNKIHCTNQAHLWIIYISRVHCHFVKTGARITFKAHSDLNISKWGLCTVYKQDIFASEWGSKKEWEYAMEWVSRTERELHILNDDIEAKKRHLRKEEDYKASEKSIVEPRKIMELGSLNTEAKEREMPERMILMHEADAERNQLKIDKPELLLEIEAMETKKRQLTNELCRVGCPPFVYVHESCSSSSGPKIQLPYNWLVTEEEENEKMEAEQKENNISNLGL